MNKHERYTWAIATATRLARGMHLRDRDDAVGQALLVFHQRILPAYDGRRPFKPYAAVALRRNLLESLRKQLACKLLAVESLDDVPARPERTTVDFHRMVKWLPDREAEVFLRRYRDHQSLATIAADLAISVRVVQEDIKKARRAIRVHWGARQHELVEEGPSDTLRRRSPNRRKKAR